MKRQDRVLYNKLNKTKQILDRLVDAKFQCMLDNNVLIITEDTHFENNEE